MLLTGIDVAQPTPIRGVTSGAQEVLGVQTTDVERRSRGSEVADRLETTYFVVYLRAVDLINRRVRRMITQTVISIVYA